MMRKWMIAAAALSFAMCLSVPAGAETITSEDGVISVETPGENWKAMADPGKCLTLSDGANMLTVEHYSNGEKLPDMSIADDHYVNVFQGVYSTQNEVFVLTGSLVDAAKIEEVTSMIMSAKVLQYNTKMAVRDTSAVSASEFSLTPLDKTMYVKADSLNVRTGCSTDDAIVTTLNNGDSVQVTGSVQRKGEDYGWYQVSVSAGTGFVSADFLTDTPVASQEAGGTKSTTAETNASGTELVQCEYCGGWYEAGNIFRNHVCPARDAAMGIESGDSADSELVQCEYCGGWYEAGNVFRNHVCPARDAAMGIDSGESGDSADSELVQCEYCGGWYEAGNVFRNHVCPARDAALGE